MDRYVAAQRAHDVTRHRHFWKDSDALDRHLLQLIADRARGVPIHLAHIEQEEYDEDLESVLNEETGETYLCRLEPKTGKLQIVKTRCGLKACWRLMIQRDVEITIV